MVFLYTNNKLSEKEINKNNLIYSSINKNKILRTKLSQRGERLVH